MLSPLIIFCFRAASSSCTSAKSGTKSALEIKPSGGGVLWSLVSTQLKNNVEETKKASMKTCFFIE
jgi:hypothetical protein